MDSDLVDVLLKLSGFLTAAAASVFGVAQYIKTQRWKRAEWVAAEFRAFSRDPQIAAAMRMIDWGGRDVPLFPDREEPIERSVYVTDDDVVSALMYHGDRDEPFSPKEAAIRDCFDAFLDGLDRFEQFIQSGLIQSEDVQLYLAYWLYHIQQARPGNPKTARLVQLQRYIDIYCFRGVQHLFARFDGVDLLGPTPPEISARSVAAVPPGASVPGNRASTHKKRQAAPPAG